MELTKTLISTVIGYMTKSLKTSNSFKKFTEDFSAATINWIRPIFLEEDNSQKEVLTDLLQQPNDVLNIQAAENAIAKAIRNEPKLKENLKSMVRAIEGKTKRITKKTNTQTISGNKNINIQDISGSTLSINSED